MNISHKQKEKLKHNWGEKAEAMNCQAEVRFYDPLSAWECYVFALNPENEDEIACLVNGFYVEVCDWRLSELAKHYNTEGEHPMFDQEYRPRNVAQLFKKLSEGEVYDTRRD